MSWLILEGLDRSGKSSVAELYRQQGYEVVHMTAPSKNYTENNYSGPSYLDDLIDLIMQYDGKDVVWDRSWYGELIWPHVYGRSPLLSEEDLEIIKEFEDRNNCVRIFMHDQNLAAHWARCVENKEPLNNSQFRLANNLYLKMTSKYEFQMKQYGDFNGIDTLSKTKSPETSNTTTTEVSKTPTVSNREDKIHMVSDISSVNHEMEISGLDKLEKANAISAVLSKRIVKQRGDAFDAIEREITNFLKERLGELLGNSKKTADQFSETEMQVLKLLCQRFMDKESQEKQKPMRRS